MNTDIFKDFILRLEADIKEPVFLIVDHLRVHNAKLLQSWLDEQWKKNKFRLFYLPSYSPELNPDEYLNRDVKAHLSETKISKTADELTETVRLHLTKKTKHPSSGFSINRRFGVRQKNRNDIIYDQHNKLAF